MDHGVCFFFLTVSPAHVDTFRRLDLSEYHEQVAREIKESFDKDWDEVRVSATADFYTLRASTTSCVTFLPRFFSVNAGVNKIHSYSADPELRLPIRHDPPYVTSKLFTLLFSEGPKVKPRPKPRPGAIVTAPKDVPSTPTSSNVGFTIGTSSPSNSDSSTQVSPGSTLTAASVQSSPVPTLRLVKESPSGKRGRVRSSISSPNKT